MYVKERFHRGPFRICKAIQCHAPAIKKKSLTKNVWKLDISYYRLARLS